MSTEKSRLDGNRLAYFESRDIRSDFGDDTGEFMSDGDGDGLSGDGVR